MNYYPYCDAPSELTETLPQNFSNVVYYNHYFLPRFQLLYALEHILSMTHFGLGLIGDRNGDGVLDFHELETHMRDIKNLSKSDSNLIAGTKILLHKFKQISSGRFSLTEQYIATYTDRLLFDLATSSMMRPLSDQVLCMQLSYVLQKYFLASPRRQKMVPLLNAELEKLGSAYRVTATYPYVHLLACH